MKNFFIKNHMRIDMLCMGMFVYSIAFFALLLLSCPIQNDIVRLLVASLPPFFLLNNKTLQAANRLFHKFFRLHK
jgi:hypothetical protein